VAGLKRYPEKGGPGIALEEAVLREGLGMEGDFHASGGDRQISLLPLEARLWMAGQEKPGLCFPRFKENISLRDLPPELLQPGTRLMAGETTLELSSQTKSCFEECRFFSRAKPCVLAGLHLFARVIRGGLIRTGDGVKVREEGGGRSGRG
jgi:MOSC domain-containing protein YiiM